MASEKGDLPQDTDSLPPHYATSEAFTDSPPPVSYNNFFYGINMICTKT